MHQFSYMSKPSSHHVYLQMSLARRYKCNNDCHPVEMDETFDKTM